LNFFLILVCIAGFWLCLPRLPLRAPSPTPAAALLDLRLLLCGLLLFSLRLLGFLALSLFAFLALSLFALSLLLLCFLLLLLLLLLLCFLLLLLLAIRLFLRLFSLLAIRLFTFLLLFIRLFSLRLFFLHLFSLRLFSLRLLSGSLLLFLGPRKSRLHNGQHLLQRGDFLAVVLVPRSGLVTLHLVHGRFLSILVARGCLVSLFLVVDHQSDLLRMGILVPRSCLVALLLFGLRCGRILGFLRVILALLIY